MATELLVDDTTRRALGDMAATAARDRRPTRQLPHNERDRWNLIITGPPGAGKSTVADTYARDLRAAGVVGRGLMITGRPELLGRTPEQSAARTRGVLAAARSGVLIVESPYELLRPDLSAAATVLAALHENLTASPGEPVVILTGYSRGMDQFLGERPEFAARFPRRLDLAQPSTSDLWRLFVAEMALRGDTVAADAEPVFCQAVEQLREGCGDELHQCSGLDRACNFRLARDVAQLAVLARAVRLQDRLASGEPLNLMRADDVHAAVERIVARHAADHV